jgi:DNA polymerase III subunit delta'
MSWRHVLGHDGNVAAFASAWKRGRLGHAYLFVGPTGVGKHTFAIELAKTVLCENRRARFEACDQCASCHLVDARTHPDLFMVQRGNDSLEFKIEIIREQLLPNLAMKPARGSRKVAILDDADDLNEEASNCFLKTLEEPPPGSLLILVGGPNAERQLPTILSRCQVIRFTPPAQSLVARILADKGIADTARQQRLLQLAAGSPGQALTLDDEEVWKFRDNLLQTLGGGKLVPDTIVRSWMEFIENAGKESAAQRERAALIVRLLVLMLENALKLSLGASVKGLDAKEEQILHNLGTSLGEERLLAWIDRALDADRQIDYRVQLVLLIEALVDALCREPAEATSQNFRAAIPRSISAS